MSIGINKHILFSFKTYEPTESDDDAVLLLVVDQ